MPTSTAPVLVAACGNLLAGDDAFGPLVAEQLRAQPVPGLEVVDLGMKPAGLTYHLEGRQALILVDAALATPELPGGQLVEAPFESPEWPQLVRDATLSSHGLSLAHELQLARRLRLLPPHVHLIAVTVRETTMGQPMCETTRTLVASAAERIVQLASRYLGTSGESCRA